MNYEIMFDIIVFGAPVIDVIKKNVDEKLWKAFDLTAPLKSQKDKIRDPEVLDKLIPPYISLFILSLSYLFSNIMKIDRLRMS